MSYNAIYCTAKVSNEYSVQLMRDLRLLADFQLHVGLGLSDTQFALAFTTGRFNINNCNSGAEDGKSAILCRVYIVLS